MKPTYIVNPDLADDEIEKRLRRLANYAECRNPELERAQDTLRKVVLSTIAELELAKRNPGSTT